MISAMNLQLRPMTEEDLTTLFEHQHDPEAAQMAAFPSRDREAYFAHWGRILPDESIAKVSIIVDEELCGHLVEFEQFGLRTVGYWLGREFWGRGIATQALREFLGTIAHRPLYARVAQHNIGSIRVLEKCGFKVCGEGRIPMPNGQAVDEFVMLLAGT